MSKLKLFFAHSIFRPSLSSSEIGMEDYETAEHHNNKNCSETYPACEINVIDFFPEILTSS